MSLAVPWFVSGLIEPEGCRIQLSLLERLSNGLIVILGESIRHPGTA